MPLLTSLNELNFPSTVNVGDPAHASMTSIANTALYEIRSWGNALEANAVVLTGTQTISGIKTFSNGINVGAPTSDNMATNKVYVDNALDGKANSSHTHTIANITGLQAALDGKQATISTGLTSQFYRGDKIWQEIAIADISGLQAAIDGKQPLIAVGANTQYFRGDKTWAALNWDAVDGKPSTFTPATHTHVRADITGMSGGTSGQVLARSGADGLTWITLTGDEVPVAVETVNGMIGDVVLTLSDLGTSVQAIAQSHLAYETWHDVFAFGRHIALPTYEVYDGSWNSTALPTSIFDNKESTSSTVITGSTTACRFTWSNPSNLPFSSIEDFIISYAYTETTRTVNVLIESSSDGSSWTTVASGVSASTNGSVTDHYAISAWGSSTYLRITITKTDGSGTAALLAIKGITKRKGDQGGGNEFSYPLDWDINRKITVEDLKINKTSVVGQVWAATNTSGDGAWSNVPAHTHSISAVTDLQTELDGKASTSHTHAIANITNLQTTLNGKAAIAHSHIISDTADLQATLDAKAPATRSISAGTGLTGGGNLSSDRTISLSSTSITSLGRADIAVRAYKNGVSDSNIKAEVMTAAQYAALGTKDANTIYFVT